MFMSRILVRTLFSAAKSETSAAATATAAASVSAPARTARNPLEEFFEVDRNFEDEKPAVYGHSWKASELRLKSWDDLNKLWYVLLKEKNMLMTQRQMLKAQNLRFPNPERIPKDLGDATNLSYLLESYFEELGDVTADIVPMPIQALADAVRKNSLNVTVARKWQIRLYVGQPLTEVEMALRSIINSEHIMSDEN